MIYPYTYWKADELPLHKIENHQSLRWNPYSIDKPVSWFLAQVHKYSSSPKPIVAEKHTSYGQRLFSDEDILILGSTEEYGTPDWKRQTSQFKKSRDISFGRYSYGKNYHFLPQDRHCRGFLFLHTPFLRRVQVDYKDKDGPNKSCLVFVAQEGGWVLYPRSLLYASYPGSFKSRVPASFLKGKRGEAWIKGVQSLPDYAWTLQEGHEAKPYMKYSNVDKEFEYESRRESEFWKNCGLSLLALFLIHGEAPPPYEGRSYFGKMVHYSLKIDDNDPSHMKTDFEWYVWESRYCSQDEKPNHPDPSRWSQNYIRIRDDFIKLILKMAPDTPYFFENAGPSDDMMSMDHCTGSNHILPWVRVPDDLSYSTSAHDVFAILKRLPANWQAEIVKLHSQHTS